MPEALPPVAARLVHKFVQCRLCCSPWVAMVWGLSIAKAGTNNGGSVHAAHGGLVPLVISCNDKMCCAGFRVEWAQLRIVAVPLAEENYIIGLISIVVVTR